jgi:hypothetical protein
MSSNSDERRRFVSKQIKIENLKEIKGIVKECNILKKRIEDQTIKINNYNDSIDDYIRERDELIRLRAPLLEEYEKIRKKQNAEKYAKSIACSLIDEYNNSSGGKKGKKIKKNKISVKAPKKKKKPTKYSR